MAIAHDGSFLVNALFTVTDDLQAAISAAMAQGVPVFVGVVLAPGGAQ